MAFKSEERVPVSDEDVSMDSSSAESATSSAGESSSESGSESESESTATSTKPSAHAPQPYKAPPGFKSVKQQSAPKSNVSSLLSDLRGKQVYHITAPDYLPLSKVEEVSLAKIMQGKPVLKYKGVQYGIPVESIKQPGVGGETLQLYDQKTKTYYSTAASNIPSYHIQELVDLPRESEADILAAVKEQVKPPRKQPKNLKMRFHPVGSGQLPPETIGSSSEESEGEEEPTFKVPKSVEKEREERKRKHHPTEEEGAPSSEVSRKKSKKHTSSQEAEPVEADEDKKSKKKSSKSRDEKKRKKADKVA